MTFLTSLPPGWNISLFHYRNQGADYGRILVGLQVPKDEVPRIPIMQPTMDVAMQKNVNGYMYWFHLQPDYRQLFKA